VKGESSVDPIVVLVALSAVLLTTFVLLAVASERSLEDVAIDK
jgi:hypothetical protein